MMRTIPVHCVCPPTYANEHPTNAGCSSFFVGGSSHPLELPHQGRAALCLSGHDQQKTGIRQALRTFPDGQAGVVQQAALVFRHAVQLALEEQRTLR